MIKKAFILITILISNISIMAQENQNKDTAVTIQTPVNETFIINLEENNRAENFVWKYKITPQNGITLLNEIQIDPEIVMQPVRHVWGYNQVDIVTGEKNGYFEKDEWEMKTDGKPAREWHFIGKVVGEYVILFKYTDNQTIKETRKFIIKITK